MGWVGGITARTGRNSNSVDVGGESYLFLHRDILRVSVMNIISEDISVGDRFNKLYQLMSQSVLSAAWLVVLHVTQTRAEQETTEIACWNH